MKVTSSGIINGIIQDKYGKRGTQFNEAKKVDKELSIGYGGMTPPNAPLPENHFVSYNPADLKRQSKHLEIIQEL